MRGRIAAFIFLAAAMPAGAGAMSSSGAPLGHCRVVAGGKLLAGSGGADALCAEIERAVAAAAPRAHYSAEIRAMPRARLSATLVVDGRTLPEQNFALMDRELGPDSMRRFAAALAAEVAKAAK
jgi:hypothetical protein